MELFKAANQWAKRPDDERFFTLEEMEVACDHYRMNARVANVQTDALTMVAGADDVYVVGSTGVQARVMNYAFGQLAARAKAPAYYLRTLPAPMAAQALNHGLRLSESTTAQLLFHAHDGEPVLRAATSQDYGRVWNSEVVSFLGHLDGGWRLPPGRAVPGARSRPATEEDVLKNCGHKSLGIKVGDPISPSGAYASDHDMFVFMVDDGKRIEVPGASMSRGFILWNSEVGDKSLGIQTFLFDAVCGNHIVWGATELTEIRINHTKGITDGRWNREIEATVVKYANGSGREEEAKIIQSQKVLLGADKKAVIDGLFANKGLGLPRKTLEAAYAVAEAEPRYGDPKSVWGMVGGLTEVAQKSPHANERTRIDRSAGKVLEMAF